MDPTGGAAPPPLPPDAGLYRPRLLRLRQISPTDALPPAHPPPAVLLRPLGPPHAADRRADARRRRERRAECEASSSSESAGGLPRYREPPWPAWDSNEPRPYSSDSPGALIARRSRGVQVGEANARGSEGATKQAELIEGANEEEGRPGSGAQGAQGALSATSMLGEAVGNNVDADTSSGCATSAKHVSAASSGQEHPSASSAAPHSASADLAHAVDTPRGQDGELATGSVPAKERARAAPSGCPAPSSWSQPQARVLVPYAQPHDLVSLAPNSSSSDILNDTTAEFVLPGMLGESGRKFLQVIDLTAADGTRIIASNTEVTAGRGAEKVEHSGSDAEYGKHPSEKQVKGTKGERILAMAKARGELDADAGDAAKEECNAANSSECESTEGVLPDMGSDGEWLFSASTAARSGGRRQRCSVPKHEPSTQAASRLTSRLRAMEKQMSELEATADAIENELSAAELCAVACESMQTAQRLNHGAAALGATASFLRHTYDTAAEQQRMLERLGMQIQPPVLQASLPHAEEAVIRQEAEDAMRAEAAAAKAKAALEALHGTAQSSGGADQAAGMEGASLEANANSEGGAAAARGVGVAFGRRSEALPRRVTKSSGVPTRGGRAGGRAGRGARGSARSRRGAPQPSSTRPVAAHPSATSTSRTGSAKAGGQITAETLVRAAAERQRERHLGARLSAAESLLASLMQPQGASPLERNTLKSKPAFLHDSKVPARVH